MIEMMMLKNELNSIANNFNQAVKKLHTLRQVTEFKHWIITYELEKQILFNEVDQIKNHRILNYNEQKVKEGLAECISAINYPIEVEKLTLKNKLNRLLNQAALNENVTRNSVHISLNFDPSEQLSKEQLNEIADTYMQKIGFGEQPYLVYRHTVAGHPHIHIVTIL